MKMEKAESLGFTSPHLHLPDDATQADVLAAVGQMNDADDVDAVLIQHPTPPQIDFDAALLALDPAKDVDGLHPVNMGRLALGMPGPVPCTPAGIEALLAHYEIPVVGPGGLHPRPGHHPRPAARPAAVAEAAHRQRRGHRRPHRRARTGPTTPGGPTSSSPPPACPGILQPEHITPGAVVVGGGVRYEGRRLLPDVDERCEEVGSPGP